MSKKIIIANWKMNPVSEKRATELFVNTGKSFSGLQKTEVVACVPFIYLGKLRKLALGRSQTGEAKKIKLGAQNVFYEESGAYTGEISAPMLYDTGARYVILGHSERRA